MKFKIALAASLTPKEVEEIVLNDSKSKQILDGQTPKKVIVVPQRIVNVVY